jgi:ABC-2 type transport system permease protein
LATLFNLAFSNLSNAEAYKSVDIAVVDSEQYQKDTDFQNFINQYSRDDADNDRVKLFNVRVVPEDEAGKMLDNNEIAGYIVYGSPFKFIVKNSGFDQSIVKIIFDDYSQTVNTIGSILSHDQTVQPDVLVKDASNRIEFTGEVQVGTKEKPDIVVNYFYALIAMACFYGAFFGLKEIIDIQADLSKRAARLNIVPVHKLKILTAGLFSCFLVLIVEMMLLMSYLVFVLKIDFGNQIGYILLTCIIGSAAGITFGAFISALVKKSDGVKIAILIASTMTASFLAGMMFDKMKYIIQQNVPVLSYLNPIALITDAFYALYYYDTHTRFFINIGLLSGFTVLFCLVTYLIIRRQKYDSI